VGKIVVGVDGSPGSLAALRFALEEARLRGSSLTAVFAWTIPFVADVPSGLLPSLLADFREDAVKVLEDVVGEIDTNGVEVERLVVEGPAGGALVWPRRLQGAPPRLCEPAVRAPRAVPGRDRPASAR
jgi:nucleotide-binding universal stress UspA family protein